MSIQRGRLITFEQMCRDLEAFSVGEISLSLRYHHLGKKRWTGLVASLRCSAVAIVTRAACSACVEPCLGCRQLGDVCPHPHYCSVYVNVWVSLSEWVPEVVCNGERGSDEASPPQKRLLFTCLSLAYLQQMRNCALRIRGSQFIFRSCRLFAGCVCGDCRVETKRSSFICTTPCDSNVHLNHNIDLLSFLLIPPKAACVCVCVTILGIEISFFLNFHIVHCPHVSPHPL